MTRFDAADYLTNRLTQWADKTNLSWSLIVWRVSGLSSSRSYISREFRIDDPDARLRDPEDLKHFLRDPVSGQFVRLPVGLKVTVEELRRLEVGGLRIQLFARVRDAVSGAPVGWTSTGNLAGNFIGETLERVEPVPGAGRYSITAAWSEGQYTGQINLIEIVDAELQIEVIAEATVAAFLGMSAAAKADGVAIHLTSGFRTWAEQKQLRDGWDRRLPGYYPAALPGYSKHQNGVAFDIRVHGSYDSDEYLWLARNATAHGFLRTVSGEPHHWEFLPEEAATARSKGRHKRNSVKD